MGVGGTKDGTPGSQAVTPGGLSCQPRTSWWQQINGFTLDGNPDVMGRAVVRDLLASLQTGTNAGRGLEPLSKSKAILSEPPGTALGRAGHSCIRELPRPKALTEVPFSAATC